MFFQNQRCVLHQDTKQPDKVSTRKIQSSPQVIMLLLLHTPTQEGVSALRHWVHFSRKEIKNTPKYLSTISWKPSAGPLSRCTLWWVTSSIRESELSLSPLQPCLMLRYLQDPRHDGAGWFLRLHTFWTCYLWGLQRQMRHCICPLDKSGVRGRKEIHKYVV